MRSFDVVTTCLRFPKIPPYFHQLKQLMVDSYRVLSEMLREKHFGTYGCTTTSTHLQGSAPARTELKAAPPTFHSQYHLNPPSEKCPTAHWPICIGSLGRIYLYFLSRSIGDCGLEEEKRAVNYPPTHSNTKAKVLAVIRNTRREH